MQVQEPHPPAGSGDGLRPGAPRLDPISVALLKRAFADRDYATRLVAVEAIGQVPATALTVDMLEEALGDPEHDVRLGAVESLTRLRTPRTLALLRGVRDDDKEQLDIRAAAAAAVLYLTTP